MLSSVVRRRWQHQCRLSKGAWRDAAAAGLSTTQPANDRDRLEEYAAGHAAGRQRTAPRAATVALRVSWKLAGHTGGLADWCDPGGD